MDELRLAQLLHKDISEDKKLEILKNLDITYSISGKCSATQGKIAFLHYNCLHIAVMKSDLDLMPKLLNLGANVLQQGAEDGKTPLRKAIDYVNYLGTPVWKLMGVLREQPFVNTLLSAQIKSNNPLNAKCKNGISHLHVSCMFNHAEAVQYFARFNEPINQVIHVDSNELPGYTPLHCAIRYSSSETAFALLTLGADIYLENAQGINAVCYLIERLLDAHDYVNVSECSDRCFYEKEIERLDSILKVIVLKNRTDDSKLVENTGLSAFHLACILKDNCIVQSYIAWSFEDVNKPVTCKSKLWSGWTPLHFAACCNIQTFKLLLKVEADVRIKNANGETAFDLCLKRYSLEVSLSYLSMGTVQFDRSKQIPDLILAMSKQRTDKEFLQTLKDINVKVPHEFLFWSGYNLLHMSIAMHGKMNPPQAFYQETDSSSYVELQSNSLCELNFKMALENGCSVYAKNADGLTPIHLAFKLHEWDFLVKLLIHAHENVVGPGNLSFLHIACIIGDEDAVEHLLERGANINSPITHSFEWHVKPRSLSQLGNQSNLPKVLIRTNSTPLHIAVILKREKVVEILLERHPDVHAEDELGLTPLHLCLVSTKRIAQLLLNGASNLRDVRRENGLSHLHVAAFADDEEAVKKLLRDGADVNGFIKDTVPDCLAAFVGKTPLHLAIEGEKAAFILVKQEANIFAENPTCNYETPLDLAMRELNSRVSEFIFERIKTYFWMNDLTRLTASDFTTLHIACATFDLEWTRNLLKRGANPNARMKDGQGRANTPMHLVIAKVISTQRIPRNFRLLIEFILLIELLLEYGADVTISNNFMTPLHLIANSYFKQDWFDPNYRAILLTIADLMLSNQRSYVFNPTDADGFSHFHFACMTNNIAVIKNYLANGVDVNHSKCPFADKNGGYTLHFAIEHKNVDVIRLLLDRGADVRAEDTNGNTPLHLALLTHFIDLQLFGMLLQNGADINAKNLKNETPIVRLLHNTNITYEQLHFFVNRGSSIDLAEAFSDGRGILGLIMKNTIPSHVEIVFEKFIEFFNVKDAINKGFLAIHNIVSVEQSQHLTRDRYLNTIQKLTEKGSDIDEQDENGKRALNAAISFLNLGAIEALLILGATVNVHEDNHHPVLHACESSHFMRNHLWKMTLLKLELNYCNRSIMENERLHPDENTVRLYQAELEKIGRTRICQSLTAKHFLSDWGAVIEYRSMLAAERQAVDNFFKQGDELREEFPEFAGLLMMQYRKALARVKLIQPVKDILVASGIDFPDLCLEAILKYFKNSELSFLIEEAANEVSHPCKRRKIQ